MLDEKAPNPFKWKTFGWLYSPKIELKLLNKFKEQDLQTLKNARKDQTTLNSQFFPYLLTDRWYIWSASLNNDVKTSQEKQAKDGLTTR